MLPEWFAQLGLMAWPLAICSVLTLAICFERSLFIMKIWLTEKSRYQYLMAALEENKSKPKPIRDELVSIIINELRRPYFSGVAPLRIIGTISPMLGLLGTILGIISVFKVIASQTTPVSPNMIAGGLWEAMLTTAVGLIIALPALLMAHSFHHIAQRQLDNFFLQLNKLSMSYELEKNSTSLLTPDDTAQAPLSI